MNGSVCSIVFWNLGHRSQRLRHMLLVTLDCYRLLKIGPHLGGVCVWHIWIDVKLLLVSFRYHDFSRGTWHAIRDHVQRSYLIVWDTEPDQLCVPAFHLLTWPAAKPRTAIDSFVRYYMVAAIWTMTLPRSLTSWTFLGINFLLFHNRFIVSGIQFPTDRSDDPLLIKCVCVCVSDTSE